MVYQIRSVTLSGRDLEWLANELVVRTCVKYGTGDLAHIPEHYEACVKALDEIHLSLPQFGAKR